MNRAEKISKIVEKFGELIEIDQIQEKTEFMEFLPVVGRLDIVSEGAYWKVTFVSHGMKPFLVDGYACSVMFRKDTGDCVEDQSVSILKYKNSVKVIQFCNNKEIISIFFDRLAAVIDLAYANYFSE
jgi:hypothetical protein